eukprot:2937710-Pyramimonas_sp.AAC.1
MIAPVSVRDLARAAAVRRMWGSWASRPNPADDGMAPKAPRGYWMGPILALLRAAPDDPPGSDEDTSEGGNLDSRRILSFNESAMLRTIVGGGFWAPSRLYRLGYAATSCCPHCDAEGCDQYHIVWECP